MKKKLLFTLAVITTLQCNTLVYANAESQSINFNGNVQIITRAEQTEWKFRVVNEQPQKRLWSLTYGHWIGEWINF